MSTKQLFTIDSTRWTAVVVCHRKGCQWRGFSHSKPSAYRQLAEHLTHAHNDAIAAGRARRSAQDHHAHNAADVSQPT